MIEVHLMRRELRPTIETWSLTKSAQRVPGSVLPRADSSDFLESETLVVGDVGGSLVSPSHGRSIEPLFYNGLDDAPPDDERPRLSNRLIAPCALMTVLGSMLPHMSGAALGRLCYV